MKIIGRETKINGIVLLTMTIIFFTIVALQSNLIIFDINTSNTSNTEETIINNFNATFNETFIINETFIQSKQELLLLSYYSTSTCHNENGKPKTKEYGIKLLKKNKHWCDERFEWFCNIVRINGQILNVSINYLGDDDTVGYFLGHFRKLLDVYNYLKLLQSKYTIKQQQESIIIMFSDAFDTLYQQNISQIVNKFNKLNITKDHVLWQAEINCSPPKNCHHYPQRPPNNGGAKYLNAGGYIGYLYYVIQNFEQFIEFMQHHPHARRVVNDQDIVVRHFVDNSSNQHMALDYYSYITQAMVKMYGKIKLDEHGYFNPITKNYPSALHFNGPKNHFVEWINKFADKMLTETNGKINGDFEIQLTNYNVTRRVKYRDYCSNFTDWYY